MKIYKITDFSAIQEPAVDSKVHELTGGELAFFYISHDYFITHDKLPMDNLSGLMLLDISEDVLLRRRILKSIHDYEYSDQHLQPLLKTLRTPEFSKYKETISAALDAFLLKQKFLISPLDEKQEQHETYKYILCRDILSKVSKNESITENDTANFSMALENSGLLVQEFSQKFIEDYNQRMRKHDLMSGMEDKLQASIRDIEQTTMKDLEKSKALDRKLQEIQDTLIKDLEAFK